MICSCSSVFSLSDNTVILRCILGLMMGASHSVYLSQQIISVHYMICHMLVHYVCSVPRTCVCLRSRMATITSGYTKMFGTVWNWLIL